MSEWHRRETMQATKAHQDALREAARLRAALRAVVDFEASPDFTKWAGVIENARKALEGVE